ncbi:hypothetical protein EDB85DRAFT_2142419 [Lactarius pseudohatsudake]|nr:hypothetical protein EDB85DRAFT_2142419 [Lactarius pseudohatsudake]
MFSDPIDSSSSDTESFAEDEMYGSDTNVETISLKPDSMEPLPDQASTVAANDGMEDAGLMSETEEMCMDLKDIKLMASALCIFDMEVLFCVCPNAGPNDEQLLQAGILPSTFRQIETAFTFSVLDDFLADNLECKTTAQQYYSKLQGITNRMFPD